MARVSVIIIFFNVQRFLGAAIESVFAQSYDNWELLLVDDGSTDGSTEIARQCVRQYPEKVRYLDHYDHCNRGMSASRNLGIRHAVGEYIAFLDADDVWLPKKLETQVAILSAYPEAGMVVGPVQWWYSWTGKSADRGRDFVSSFPPGVPANSLLQPPKLLIALLQRATVSTTAALVRRAVVDRAGGFEEDFPGMFEDQAFAAKVYCRTPVFVAADYTYKWRKHPDSCCAVAVESARYDAARVEFFGWLRRYLSGQEIKHSELDRTLDDEIEKSRQRQARAASENGQNSSGQIRALARGAADRLLPVNVRDRLREWRRAAADCLPVGRVQFGTMRRLMPISGVWGFDRGAPVDRYYIKNFLAAHTADIYGRVLEFGDDNYTRQFGAAQVTQTDILHPVEGNPRATIVADLSRGDRIPSESFDCIICTQTLMFIFDIHNAMRTLYRILNPGGVLLMTLAGVSHRISRYDMERWGDYWRFTSLSARRLCETVFPPANMTVESFGNVLTAIAFLHGLAQEELHQEELDSKDPDYEVLIAVRAVKPAMTE